VVSILIHVAHFVLASKHAQLMLESK
jgi:hypothetical protein